MAPACGGPQVRTAELGAYVETRVASPAPQPLQQMREPWYVAHPSPAIISRVPGNAASFPIRTIGRLVNAPGFVDMELIVIGRRPLPTIDGEGVRPRQRRGTR